MAERNEPISASGWKELMLNFNDGSSSRVKIDGPTYNLITEGNDQTVLTSLSKQYKNLYGKQMISVAFGDSPNKTQPWVESHAESHEEERLTCYEQETESEPLGKKINDSWRHEAVLLLISLYTENKEKFRSPEYKQKDVWKMISEQMAIKGHDYDAGQCNEKFRSLKFRHRKIANRNEKSGRGRSTWQYYELMEYLLAEDPTIRPVHGVASAATPKKPAEKIQPSTTTSNNYEIETPVVNSGKSGWRHEAVLLLISLCAENKEKFESSEYKQKDVWKMISEQITLKGYDCDARQCDEKYRALKFRHKKIRDGNELSGRGGITWQYYELMEDLLAGDTAVRPVQKKPAEKIIASTITSTTTSNNDEIETPVVKRMRKSDEAPEWFKKFMNKMDKTLDSIDKDNKLLIKISRERNVILNKLADAMMKK